MRVAVLALLVVGCSSSVVPKVGGFTVDRTGSTVKVTSADGRLLIDASGFQAGRGRSRIESQFGSFRFTDSPTDWAADTVKVEAESPADGELLLTFRSTDATHNRIAIGLACQTGEHFLGFGAQADGVDHRGHKVPIWTSEPGIGKNASDDPGDLWFLEGARHASSFGLPTWLSSRGYIGAVQSDARTVLDVCAASDSVFRLETWSNELKLWVFDGPTPAAALERATGRVLGRPPQPPAMAFAPWNDAIYGPASVREVAATLRDAGIPSSALWTEDFRGGRDEGNGVYRLEEDWYTDALLYPDAGSLAAQLHRDGFAWQAYFNSFVVKTADVYSEASASHVLVGASDGGERVFDGVTFAPTTMLDLSNPAGRELIKKALRAALDVGFDGWMADYGEWLPPDAVLFSGEDPLLAHNRYAAEWVKLNREVLDERAGDGRQRLFFARAGWFGSTHDTPVVWAGDQRTSFQKDDGLYTVIPMGLGLALAGVSTYGSDIAGYQSSTNPVSTKELFFRWTSMGALMPVMRTHHGLSARQNWNFRSDAQTLAHYRRWATFHIQLFPYLDGASVEAETKGLPLMRALALAFPDDADGWAVSDEYLLGPSMLVAPVVDESATSRTVHLPPGTWYRWPSGDVASASGIFSAAVHEIPIFLRAGAIVPRLPARVQTLVPADPPVVDLDDVARERDVLVAPGQGQFTERDARSWVSTASGPGGAGSPSASVKRDGAWVGLSACATAEATDCLNGEVLRVSPHGAPVTVGCGESSLDVPAGFDRVEITFISCR